MKKIDAIIKGCKFTDKLFGLKKRQIFRTLEAALDDVERQKEDASIAYEELLGQMGENDADYQDIIACMLEHKQTIISADETLKVLTSIKDDLNAEVTVEED